MVSDASKNKQHLMLHTECDVYSVVYVFTKNKRFTIMQTDFNQIAIYPVRSWSTRFYYFILKFAKKATKQHQEAFDMRGWKSKFITFRRTRSCSTVNKVILSVL